MSQFRLGIGQVVSADIAVPRHPEVLSFYSSVLTTGKKPLWREDLMNNLGAPVIGLGAQSEAYAHLPLLWMPHIQVKDVGQSVSTALELGGSELMHQKGKDGKSQWAVIQDPQGAAFGIMPVLSNEMLPEVNDEEKVGRIAWLDLTVTNALEIREFYESVVGWTVEDVAMGSADESYADFNMCGEDGEPSAGVCHARAGNMGLPPVWLLYLPVGDIEESLRRVDAGGGKLIKEVRNRDGGISYAVFQDPVGAYMALVP